LTSVHGNPARTRIREIVVPRPLRRAIPVAAAAAAVALASADAAHAQTRSHGTLDGHYTATLAGIPVGKGVWMVEISDNEYSVAASGRTTGLLNVFASGRGTSATRGVMNAGKPVSANYSQTVVYDKKTDDVRIALSGGNVKDYRAEPPPTPVPDRVPVTDAHRRGVVDPMSGGLMVVAGSGDPLRPDACKRTIAVFDGRGRFDITMSYKRMDQVRAEKGYQGPVVVCMVRYHPVSGHRPNRWAIKYLMETRDIEAWLAPIAGTRVLVPYRIALPTTLGPAVLEATQFVTAAQATRSTPAATNAKTH
jgi:Protein of unknown function (DUF3108)